MRTYLLGLTALTLAACSTAPPAPDLTDWRSETIRLPPEFAPRLPSGDEVLLFAPGMFEEGAPDFWSYVFLMEVNEAEIGTERLEEILELYYDGLIGRVGSSNGYSLTRDPAQVSVESSGEGTWSCRVTTFDVFVTGDPLELHMFVERRDAGDRKTRLAFRASPVPPDGGEIWRSLDAALESLSL